ncbi:MAG TPA: ABC transporter permease, partial [Anaerolineae bacterium]|nr:ABC transporter permease [Anaerolineae bacterium]
MLDDILTVMWKERKSIFRHKGSRSRFLLVLLSPVLFAVVFPWQWGADWVQEMPSVVLSIIMSVILVGITIPESFAGERERHTLGTLLASRLPDRAILIGKLLVSIALAWGMTLVVLLLSLVTVNIAHGEGRLLLYSPTVAIADLVLSFLLATLFSGAGILVSMRTETVQQASQIVMSILLVPAMILQVIGLVAMTQDRDLIRKIASLDGEQLLLIVLAVLIPLTVGVLTAAVLSF